MKMDDSDFDEYVEFYNEKILWQNKRYFRDVESPLVIIMINNLREDIVSTRILLQMFWYLSLEISIKP